MTFVARGAHLAAHPASTASRFESALGDVLIRPAQASDDPARVGPVDLVIFAVKLYDTEAAADAAGRWSARQTGVVTFQNGVDSPEVLARALGADHVIGGVAQIAAVIAAPGVIRHTGTMARFCSASSTGQSRSASALWRRAASRRRRPPGQRRHRARHLGQDGRSSRPSPA